MDDPLVDKFLLKPGDFLISRSNTADKVGRVAVFRGEIEQCSYPDLMMRFRPNPNLVDLDYLELYLKSEAVVSHIQKHATGTSGSMKKINQATVEGIPVALPSVREQRNIAAIVRDWYAAVETTERLIAAKERRHRALLVLLLGKRLWSESSHERADSLFNSISERNRPDLPVLAVTQDQGVVPRATLDRRITMELSDPATFKVVRRDDFVISLRSFQGGLEHSAYDGLVSPAYTVLRCGPALLPRFYRHYLKSPDFLKRLSVAVVGIRDGKQINFADFASLKLPLPNFERQQAIAAVLDESEKEIDLLGQSLVALKRQKRGLMQKLLTGEWRVPLPDTESTVKEAAPC
jgi:type I restriction enzyme S subunit